MVDFKLILLLLGLGFLLLVAISVLVGSLAGIKKELKCTAITLVVLVVALLVFGNPSTILNADGGMLKGILQGVPASAKTVWDVVVAFAQSSIPGGTNIFVDGTESYAFLYAFVSGIVRAVALIAGIVVSGILLILVNGIYRIVSRIVASKKAKKQNPSESVEPAEPESAVGDKVVVLKKEDGASPVVVTTSKNSVPKKSHSHLWGGVLAFVKSIVIIIIIMTPISGLMSVLNEVTPETEALIKNTLNGQTVQTSQTDDLVDTVMDFRDAYNSSLIGKFTEGSAFFFKESFSTHLFDATFNVKVKGEKIALREEINTFIDVANGLDGNNDFANLSDQQVSDALDALKDSKLLPAVMPVAIEVLYYIDINGIKPEDLLFESGQQTAFLNLREADWDTDLATLLDAVKEFYKLGFLKSDFNYLVMDEEILRAGVDKLAEVNALTTLLNIAIQTAVKLDVVTEKLGAFNAELSMADFDWKAELNDIVDIYAEFKKLGITTLNGLDTNALIADIVNDDAKFNALSNILVKAVDLQLVDKVGLELASNYVVGIPTVQDKLGEYLEDVRKVVNALPEDVPLLLEAVKELLPYITIGEGLKVNVDYLHMDPLALDKVVDKLFATTTVPTALPIATHIALNLPAFKNLIGEYDVTITPENINWKQDFTTLISIYSEFLKLGVNDVTEITADPLAYVKGVSSDTTKMQVLENVVTKLTELGLFEHVVANIAGPCVNTFLKKSEFSVFADVLDLKLSVDEWKQDLVSIVKLLPEVNKLCGFVFKPEAVDFSEEGMTVAGNMIESVFSLNLLGDDAVKNDFIKLALNHFKVFAEEDIEAMDLSGVTWSGAGSEVEMLKEVLLHVAKLNAFDGMDLNTMKFDYEKLLENDAFIDEVVATLEAAVESNLLIEVIPAALNKFVLPQLEKFDDEDNTLNSIITGMSSEELVNEVLALVDAAKAAIDLGVLKISKEGIEALDYRQTDALKQIINTIFDSKLIEGNEGRIIRIILKLTKVFTDIEKDALVGIDYDREQLLLNQAIDELAVVLQDEDFVLFKDGKLNLDTNYLVKTQTLDALFKALDALFGAYTVDDETKGSALVETLLPEAYQKYVKGLVPAEFDEVVEILGLNRATGDELLSDVRHIIYSAKVLVDANIQSLVLTDDYNFETSAVALGKVLDAVFSMQSIAGKEANLVAWALNTFAPKLGINDAFFASDFADVDWNKEVGTIKQLLADVIEFAKANDIATVNKLKAFISEKGFAKDEFLSESNVDLLIEIVEDVLKLKTVDILLPVALVFGLNKVQNVLDLSFLAEDYTNEHLQADIKSLIEVIEIAVKDLDVITLYKNKFSGDLPNQAALVEVLDIVVKLRILENGKLEKVLEAALNKFLPANKFISADDLDLTNGYSFVNDFEVLKELIALAYRFFAHNNLTTIDDVKAFPASKVFLEKSFLDTYNVSFVSDALEILSRVDLVGMAGSKVVANVVTSDMLDKFGDFSCLTAYSAEMLKADLATLSNLVTKVQLADLLKIYVDGDLDPIDYNAAADVVRLVGELQVLKHFGKQLAPEALNYVLENVLKLEGDLSVADFEGINFTTEFNLIADFVKELGVLLEANNLLSYMDIVNFVKNQDYLLLDILATKENAQLLFNATDILVQSKLLGACGAAGLGVALDVANKNGLDVSFLVEGMTAKKLLDDVASILEALKVVVFDIDILNMIAEGFMGQIPAEDDVVEVLDRIVGLNLVADGKMEKLLDLVVNKFLPQNNFLNKADLDFTGYEFAPDYEGIKRVIGTAYDFLAHNNLTTVRSVLDFVNNKTFLQKSFLDTYNISFVTDLLTTVSDINIALQAIHGVVSNVVTSNMLANVGDFSALKYYTEDYISHDLKLVSNLITKAQLAKLVDIYTKGDLDPIPYGEVAQIVSSLGELKLINIFGSEITPVAVNFVLEKVLKVSERFTEADFASYDWQLEFKKIGDVILSIADLLEANNLLSVSDILNFVKNQDYRLVDVYLTTENGNLVIAVVNTVIESRLVSDMSLIGVGLGLNVAKNAGFDLSFLLDDVSKEDLVEDLHSLVDILSIVVNDMKLIEDFQSNFTGNIPEEYAVVNALDKLFGMHLLNGKIDDLLNVVVPKVLPKNNFVDAADLELDAYDFKADYAVIKDIIADVYALLGDTNLVTYARIKELISNKDWYLDAVLYEEKNINHVADILEDLGRLHILTNTLANVLDDIHTLPMLANIGDFSDLGLYEQANIAHDFSVLANFVRNLGKVNVLALITEDAQTPVDHVALGNAVKLLGGLDLLNICLPQVLANVVNMAADKLPITTAKVYYADDFRGYNWMVEFEAIGNTVIEALDFLVSQDLNSVAKIKAFVANKGFMKEEFYANKDVILSIQEVVNTLFTSYLITDLSVLGLQYGLEIANKAGIELYSLGTGITGAQFASDIKTLVQDYIYALDANVLGFALKDGALSQANFTNLDLIVIDLFNLNVLGDASKKADLFSAVLGKLGVNVDKDALAQIDYATEINTINAVIHALNKLSLDLNKTRLSQVYYMIQDIKSYLVITDKTNTYLLDLAMIVEEVAHLQLVEALILPLSNKFLASDGLKDLADLHNIYASGAEFSADLIKLASVVRSLVDLDLYHVLLGDKNIPYANEEAIVNIIEKLTSLSYINNDGRVEALVSKFVKLDLSSADLSNIDIFADGEKLVAAYKNLLPIVTDPGFPYTNVKDKYIRINLQYWLKDPHLTNASRALNNILDMTVVTETKGAILVVFALPLVKKALPDIYAALDLDNVTPERVGDDFDKLISLVDIALASDLAGIVRGEIFSSGAEIVINKAIETIFGLNIIEGHEEALINAILARFDGKKFGNVVFSASDFDFSNFDAKADALTLQLIYSDICALVKENGINNINQVTSLFQATKLANMLKSDASVSSIVSLVNHALELTILVDNALPLYNMFGKDMVAKFAPTLADLDAVYAKSSEFHADLSILGSILSDVASFGLASMYRDELINYAQPALVKEILDKAATLKYLDVNLGALVDFVDSKVKGIDLSTLDLSVVDLAADFAILGDIYEQLIPVLTDASFPIQKLSDVYRPIPLQTLKTLIYDYQLLIAAVVDKAADISLAPQIVKMAEKLVSNKLPANVKPIVQTLNIQSASDDSLREDIHTLSIILKDVKVLDILAYFLLQRDFTIINATAYKDLISHVFDLNIVKDNFTEFVEKGVNKVLKVSIDASVLDIENEEAVLKEIVSPVIDILNFNGLSSFKALLSFTKQAPRAMLGILLDDYGLSKTSKILDTLAKSGLVSEYGLEITRNKLAPLAQKNANFTDLASLLLYDNATFVEDVHYLAQMLDYVASSNLNEAYLDRTIAIDYASSAIDEIIRVILKTNFVKFYATSVVELVQSALPRRVIAVDAFVASNVEFANDAEYVVNAYHELCAILTSSKWPLRTVTDVVSVVKGAKVKLPLSLTNYPYASALGNALDALSGSTISAEIYAVVLSSIALNIKGTTDICSYELMSREEMKADYVNLAALVKSVLAFAYNGGANNPIVDKDVMINNPALIEAVLTDFANLKVFEDNYDEIIYLVLEKCGVQTGAIDLNSIDFATELPVLCGVILDGVQVLNSVGVESVKGLMPYVRSLSSSMRLGMADARSMFMAKNIKGGIKAILSEVMKVMKPADLDSAVAFVEGLCASNVFGEIALPVYNQKLATRFTGTIGTILDLSAYSVSEFKQDLPKFASVVRNLYDSKVYLGLSRQPLDVAGVPLVEEAVRAFLDTNLVLIKTADLGVVIQAVANATGITNMLANRGINANFTKYDYTLAFFGPDKDIYASMVVDVYAIFNSALSTGFNSKLLGNEVAMSAVVEMYGKFITTHLAEEVAPKVINVVNKFGARFGMKVNDNARFVLDMSYDALTRLVNLGLFSNNGIDLTKKTDVEALVGDVYSVVNLSSTIKRVINAGVRRVDAFGVIPFSWDNVSLKAEARTVLSSAKLAMSLLNKYKAQIASRDLSFLTDPNCQAEVTSLVSKVFESSIVSQVFFPVVEGAYNALTRSFSDGQMKYVGTLDDVVNNSLPNLFKLIAAASKVTGFSLSNLKLTEFAAMADMLEVLATDQFLKDNLADFVTVGFNKVLKDRLTPAEYDALAACDLKADFLSIAAALDDLQAVYDAHPFSIGVAMVKDPVVLEALCDVVDAVVATDAAQALTLKGLSVGAKLAGRFSAQVKALLNDKLEDDSYTQDKAYEDLTKLTSVLRDLSAAGILANISDFSAWNYPLVKQAVNTVLSTHFVTGNEEELFKAFVNKMPIIKDYYNDSVVIADYRAEILAMVDAVCALGDKGITDLANIMDTIDGACVYEITKSAILKDMFLSEMNKALNDLGLASVDASYIDAINATADPAAAWDAELDAIKTLKDALSDSSSINALSISNAYYQTILVKGIMETNAEAVITKVPQVARYYSSFSGDWAAELAILMSALEQIGNKSLSDFSDPLNSDLLEGKVIVKLLTSDAIKAVFVNDMNAQLDDDVTPLTIAQIDAVGAGLSEAEKAAAWDYEIECLKLLNNYSSSSISNADLIKIYRTTTLVRSAIVASAPALVGKLQGVGSYYASFTGDWEAELDIIMDAVEALDDNSLSNISNPLDSDVVDGNLLVKLFKSETLKVGVLGDINAQLAADVTPFTVAQIDAVGAGLSDAEKAAAWDNELANIKLLNKFATTSISNAQLIAMYRNTTLVRSAMIVSAPDLVDKIPVIGSYYPTFSGDWETELDIIMNVVEALGSNTISDLSNPTENLDGAIVEAALNSDVLKAVFIEELQDEVTAKGLPATEINETLIDSVYVGCTTKEQRVAAWDYELDQFRQANALKESGDLVALAAFALATESKIVKALF